jgi:hypothetical protein
VVVVRGDYVSELAISSTDVARRQTEGQKRRKEERKKARKKARQKDCRWRTTWDSKLSGL